MCVSFAKTLTATILKAARSTNITIHLSSLLRRFSSDHGFNMLSQRHSKVTHRSSLLLQWQCQCGRSTRGTTPHATISCHDSHAACCSCLFELHLATYFAENSSVTVFIPLTCDASLSVCGMPQSTHATPRTTGYCTASPSELHTQQHDAIAHALATQLQPLPLLCVLRDQRSFRRLCARLCRQDPHKSHVAPLAFLAFLADAAAACMPCCRRHFEIPFWAEQLCPNVDVVCEGVVENSRIVINEACCQVIDLRRLSRSVIRAKALHSNRCICCAIC